MSSPFDPREFAIFARQLASGTLAPVDGLDASVEARVRTAFGRAYYTLFLTVRAVISSRYGISIRRIDHGPLYTALQSSVADQKVRHIGRELERLYQLRRKADYVLDLPPADYKKLTDPSAADLAAEQAYNYATQVATLDYSPIINRF